MIQIRYSILRNPDSDALVNKHISKLPPTIQGQIKSFRFQKDRQLNLVGKLLIEQTAKSFGISKEVLGQLCYSEYKRPFLSREIDFNISHSGSCVMLVMSNKGRVGIDVEEIKKVNPDEFQDFFTSEEMADIRQSDDPSKRLFHWWTQKESLMKADGRGLYIPAREIRIIENTGYLEKQKWFLRPVPIGGPYTAHLATDWQLADENIDIQQIEFN